MFKNLLYFIVLASLAATSASAQQRVPNAGTGDVKRVWPQSGVWLVALEGHFQSKELQCNVITGWENLDAGEFYMWGWRDFKGEFAFSVADKTSRAVSGDNIQIFIDDVRIMAVPIKNRIEVNGFYSISAPITSDRKDTVLSLLKSGGSIKIITDNFTYSASLSGSRLVMRYFDECRGQADRLNTLLQNPG